MIVKNTIPGGIEIRPQFFYAAHGLHDSKACPHKRAVRGIQQFHDPFSSHAAENDRIRLPPAQHGKAVSKPNVDPAFSADVCGKPPGFFK